MHHRIYFALPGQLADFTGIDAPYEAPDAPELTIDTGVQSVLGIALAA